MSTHWVIIFGLLAALPISNRVEAQDVIVTYIKENGGQTAYRDSAVYTRILRITPNDEGLHELNEYYPNGNVRRHGWVKAPDPQRMQFEGEVETYYEEGALREVARYAANHRTDTTLRYYPNGVLKERVIYSQSTPDTRLVYYADSLGNIQVEEGTGEAVIDMGNGDVEQGHYRGGLREGHWTGTFQKTKCRFEEWYEGGVVTSGITTDSLGKQYTYEQPKVQPEYPGGVHNLKQFVAQNYQYTKAAIQARVNGQLVIAFVVDTTGIPTHYEVVNDLGYGTAAAGIDVLKKSQPWTPGYQRGVPVRVQYKLPIRLNLSREPLRPASSP